MSMVELLSIYETIWCCWNDDLLAKQKGIKEKYCIKLTSYRNTDPLQGFKSLSFYID